jgi:tetratricopeptide (TPR) repeat protein
VDTQCIAATSAAESVTGVVNDALLQASTNVAVRSGLNVTLSNACDSTLPALENKTSHLALACLGASEGTHDLSTLHTGQIMVSATIRHGSDRNEDDKLDLPWWFWVPLVTALIAVSLQFFDAAWISVCGTWLHMLLLLAWFHMRLFALLYIISWVLLVIAKFLPLPATTPKELCVAAWALCFQCIYSLYVLLIAQKTVQPAKAEQRDLIAGVRIMADRFGKLASAVKEGQNTRQTIGASRTIALFGEWGSGKSCFLRQLAALANTKEKEGLAVLYYDAWKWQSSAPPEFSLINQLYNNDTISRTSWFVKPLRLRIINVLRALRISFKGWEIAADACEGSPVRRFEMSLLADAYRKLFTHLKRAGISVLILIDEADRCERLYFQNILALVPRYLNEENSFVVCSLVYSQFKDRVFEPVEPMPTDSANMLDRCRFLASDVTLSKDGSVSIKCADQPLERYHSDLLDTLRAAKKGFAASDDLCMHVLHKFFEEEYYLAPLSDTNPSSHYILQTLQRAAVECFPYDVQLKENDQYVRDIIQLAANEIGLGGNPRLMVAAFKTVLSLMPVTADSCKMIMAENTTKLLRLGLGCYVFMQRHESEWLFNLNPDKMAAIFSIFRESILKWEAKSSSANDSHTEPDNRTPNQSTAHTDSMVTGRDAGDSYMNGSSIERAPYQTNPSQDAGLTLDLNDNMNRVVFGLDTQVRNELFADHAQDVVMNEFCRVYACSRRFFLSRTTSVHAGQSEADISRNIEVARLLFTSGESDKALAQLNDIIESCDRAGRISLQGTAVRARSLKSVLMYKTGNYIETLKLFDEISTLYGKSRDLVVRNEVARAMFNKGIVLYQREKYNEAERAYDAVVTEFGDDAELELRLQVARALVGKALCLVMLGEHEKAQKANDEVVRRFGNAMEDSLREQVASALFNKALTFARMKNPDPERELETYAELIGRFTCADELALSVIVSRSMVNKAVILARRKSFADAVQVLDDVVSRYGESQSLELREQVANALFNKAIALHNEEDIADEIDTYERILKRYGRAAELSLREYVAKALINKGTTLAQHTMSTDAIDAFDEVVKRFGKAPELSLRLQVARALTNKVVVCGNNGQHQEVMRVCDDLVRRFGDATDAELREYVAQAWINKGVALVQLNRLGDAVDVYEEFLKLYGNVLELRVRQQVAKAILNKALVLTKLNRPIDAIAAYEDIVRQFANDQDNDIRVIVDRAKRELDALRGQN